MKCTKGIILAGGTGSRLFPLTISVNKQLMPVYDKPAIYYPLSTLMLAGIKDILIISSPADIEAMKTLLDDGEHFGLSIQYKIQEKPSGLPEAFILGEDFIQKQPVAMILGDNLFYGHGLSALLFDSASDVTNAHVFLYRVKDPSLYGVAKFGANNSDVLDVVEKPSAYVSPWAVTGLYYFPADVSKRAKELKPSARGELEITDLIREYILEGRINAQKLTRGNVWFDVGSPDALLHASNFVEVLQNRQDILISSPEEVAWRVNLITTKQYKTLIEAMPKCTYRKSLELTLEP